MSHTPGPWTTSPIFDTDEYLVWGADPLAGLVYGKYPARLTGVCKLFGSPRVVDDSSLIAAAPELLEALKALVASVEAWNRDVELIIGRVPQTNIVLDQAHVAIAKAEGR